MGFWKELRERKVVRVAVIYAVTAWLLAQVAGLALPVFEAPDWVLKTLFFILLMGFPISLILAWALELTPDGVKVSGPAVGQKRLYTFAALVMAGIAIGYFGSNLSSDSPDNDGNTSIAVLPFLDLSAAGDQAYFAEGLSEQLLDLLARNTQLKVAARTSSFQFKSEPGDVKRIGELLNVNYLVEGSVRRDSDQVRITAQLIDTRSGYHEWSETYTRSMTGIFALQDEISRAIADELETRFGVDGQSPTLKQEISPAAYDEYLLGRHLMVQRTGESLEAAVDHFERAVAIEPEYGKAYAQLTICIWLLYSGGYGEFAPDVVIERGGNYLRLAQRYAPGEPETLAASAAIQVYDGIDVEEAIRDLETALKKNPSYLEAAVWLARGLDDINPQRALVVLEEAIQRDPLNFLVAANLTEEFIKRDRFDDAEKLAQKFLAIGDQRGHQLLGRIRMAQHRYADAARHTLTAHASEKGTLWDLRGVSSLLNRAGQLELMVSLPLPGLYVPRAMLGEPDVIEDLKSLPVSQVRSADMMLVHAIEKDWAASVATVDQAGEYGLASMSPFEKFMFGAVLKNAGEDGRAETVFENAVAGFEQENKRLVTAGINIERDLSQAEYMVACGKHQVDACLDALETAEEKVHL
ncbi:MAG: hypothetical protein R3217_03935, partial [Gammaproteobacteria bacterium]|nr:hypothetical protein [Gammaproteobacteria bacterium]